jgi:hypothetical protein
MPRSARSLGRDRHGRDERVRAGDRDGHREVSVDTTAEPVELYRPKLRNTLETFSSRRLGKHVTRTNTLACLVISG